MRKKALTTEQIRKQIDARFKAIVCSGEVIIIDKEEKKENSLTN